MKVMIIEECSKSPRTRLWRDCTASNVVDCFDAVLEDWAKQFQPTEMSKLEEEVGQGLQAIRKLDLAKGLEGEANAHLQAKFLVRFLTSLPRSSQGSRKIKRKGVEGTMKGRNSFRLIRRLGE